MSRPGKNLSFDIILGLILAAVATASTALNADLQSTPRFDGAGYAVLGEALATGRGYYEINRPDTPPHDHFPPGYPLALGVLWRLTGRSIVAAHLLSIVCTVMVVILAWRWFRAMYPPKTAFLLGLALAVNWTLGRVGGSIQSEPLYMFWELVAVLLACRAERRDTGVIGIALGVALAASMLTRHVGICLAPAVGVVLGLRRHWKVLIVAALTMTFVVVPWIGWLALIHHHTQLGLLTWDRIGSRAVGQSLFYIQRLADQITGPFVEVATVIHQSWLLRDMANLWATMASIIIFGGWVHTVRSRRRRLTGLIAGITLVLLLLWPFTEAGRFLIPLVPMILVGLTEGVARVVRLVRLKQPREWAAAILLGVSIPYSAYSIMNGRADAQRRLHVDFDAACTWIAEHAATPGTVLTRHPGEVFWQTGRSTIEPDSPDPDAIDRLISHLDITYILVDNERYVNAEANPLREYVRQYPGRVVLVWGRNHGRMSVQVFSVIQSR